MVMEIIITILSIIKIIIIIMIIIKIIHFRVCLVMWPRSLWTWRPPVTARAAPWGKDASTAVRRRRSVPTAAKKMKRTPAKTPRKKRSSSGYTPGRTGSLVSCCCAPSPLFTVSMLTAWAFTNTAVWRAVESLHVWEMLALFHILCVLFNTWLTVNEGFYVGDLHLSMFCSDRQCSI